MQSDSLKKLDKHLVEAQASVSNSAAEINDRVYNIESKRKKRKNREAEDDVEDVGADEAERSLEELKDKVERMTQRMEDSMRKLIDGQHSVQHIRESVTSTSEHARVNASTQASTQARTQRRRTIGEDGEEEEEYRDFEPTDPAAGTQGQPSAIEKFRQDMETAKTRYQAHSLQERYADNNNYRDFRRVVHDAQHHEDGQVLEDHTQWFPESERPAPGVTTRRSRGDGEDADSDDDIAVSKATISTRCPLTLQEFKEPLTSTQCPHSFEKIAILQMVTQARPVPVHGGRVEKAVQCPVSGCSKMLTKATLQVDRVLIRRIKRLQEAARLADEEDDEDEDGVPGTQGGATLIDDDDDGNVDDIVESRVQGTQVKGEPVATGRSAPRPSHGRAGGGVVDLAGESSDEAEEEEDDTMDE